MIIQREENNFTVSLSGVTITSMEDKATNAGHPYKAIYADWNYNNEASFTVTAATGVQSIVYKVFYQNILNEYIDSATFDKIEGIQYDTNTMTRTFPPQEYYSEGRSEVLYEILIYEREGDRNSDAYIRYLLVLKVVKE